MVELNMRFQRPQGVGKSGKICKLPCKMEGLLRGEESQTWLHAWCLLASLITLTICHTPVHSHETLCTNNYYYISRGNAWSMAILVLPNNLPRNQSFLTTWASVIFPGQFQLTQRCMVSRNWPHISGSVSSGHPSRNQRKVTRELQSPQAIKRNGLEEECKDCRTKLATATAWRTAAIPDCTSTGTFLMTWQAFGATCHSQRHHQIFVVRTMFVECLIPAWVNCRMY